MELAAEVVKFSKLAESFHKKSSKTENKNEKTSLLPLLYLGLSLDPLYIILSGLGFG